MKIKYFTLGCLFVVIVFMIVNMFMIANRDEIIIIKSLANFDNETKELDNRISKIKNDECRESFYELLANIKKTYFNENTTVDKYYDVYFSDKVFLDIYKEVETSCKIDEDDSRYTLALASYAFPSSIKSKYNLKHEVKFRDKVTREDVLKDEYEVGSYSSKVLELKVINELLESIKK